MSASALPSRIDVHSHYLPPFYRTALAENGHSHPDGMPAIPQWSPEAHLEMMSTVNVSKSILSLSSPGTQLVARNPSLTTSLTRQCNAYAANLKKKHPDKFGFWAALPLPDVEASLREIEIAMREGADGFALMTNFFGRYPGSGELDPVFDELNRRHAIIFFHPTKPCVVCSGEVMDATPLAAECPIPMYEFFFDSARAVTNLFLSGTVARCPDIRFIIPHVGGSFPPIISRFIEYSQIMPSVKAVSDEKVRGALDRQFYWDLAGVPFAGERGGMGQLKALKEGFGIGAERLLYGSDFPFTQTWLAKKLADRMTPGLDELFSEDERQNIYERNAKELLA